MKNKQSNHLKQSSQNSKNISNNFSKISAVTMGMAINIISPQVQAQDNLISASEDLNNPSHVAEKEVHFLNYLLENNGLQLSDNNTVFVDEKLF